MRRATPGAHGNGHASSAIEPYQFVRLGGPIGICSWLTYSRGSRVTSAPVSGGPWTGVTFQQGNFYVAEEGYFPLRC